MSASREPLRAVAEHSSVVGACRRCQHVGRLNLPQLISRGYADRTIDSLRVKCTKCGAKDCDMTIIKADRS
jgi:hypothetical protein